jgi:hypothetical protein
MHPTPGETRHVLVEAAWHAARTAGPLRAFHQRVAARRGGNIATVAVARKLAVIAWHMLSRGEDYACLVQDWQPAINKGTGAAPGRASCGPSSGQAARQETAPPPAL